MLVDVIYTSRGPNRGCWWRCSYFFFVGWSDNVSFCVHTRWVLLVLGIRALQGLHTVAWHLVSKILLKHYPYFSPMKSHWILLISGVHEIAMLLVHACLGCLHAWAACLLAWTLVLAPCFFFLSLSLGAFFL